MRCHTARSIAVLVASLSFGSAIANAPSWQIETPGHGPANGPVWSGAVPLSDGGALLTRSSPPNALLVWRMHPDLGLGPPQRLPGVGVLYGEVLDHGRPTLIASAPWTEVPESPGQTCARRVEALPGLDLRLFSDGALGFGRSFEHGLPALLGDGRPGHGFWNRQAGEFPYLATFFAHDADCSPRVLLEQPGYVVDLIELSESEATVALVHREAEAPGSAQHWLIRFDAEGLHWQQPIERVDGGPLFGRDLVRLPDDSVVVLSDWQPGFAQRYTADGVRLWEARIDWPEPYELTALEDGWAAGSSTVARLRPQSLITVPPGDFDFSETLVVLDANGFELARHGQLSRPSPLAQAPQHRGEALFRSANRVIRLDEDGSLEVVAETPSGNDVLLAELADRRLLLRRGADYVVWNPNGGDEHPLAPPVPTVPPRVALRGDPVGILEQSRSSTPGAWTLRSIGPDGAVAWQMDLATLAAALDVESAYPGAVDADATRVCIQTLSGETVSVPCFDRRDGSLLYPAPGFGASSWRTARVLWLTDTGPWALRRDEVSPRFLMQPAGAEQPPLPERVLLAAPVYSGDPLVQPLDARHLAIVGRAESEEYDSLRVFDVDDRLVLHVDLGHDWGGSRPRLQSAADGFLLTSTDWRPQGLPHLDLVRIAPDGGVRWRQSIERAPDPADGGGFQTVHGRDGRWLFWERTGSSLRLVALDDADGSIAWSRKRHLRGGGEPGFVLPALDGPYAVLSRRDRQLEVAWLSPVDGQLIDVSAIDEGGEIAHAPPDAPIWYATPAAPVGNTGTALSVVTNDRRRLLRIDPPQRTPPPNEPATLAGVWYDPAASGQGFTLDWYPDSATLGGAWFTYSREGGHARSEQRWYSLQAVPVEGGWLEGTLRASSGGAFAAPGSVPAEAVGSLRLRRVAADELVLDYAFDDGSPGGAILLRRLLPGAGANGPATEAGFWYYPASSGQGLYLLQDQGPVPFAAGAWFSFDPQGSADDPSAQHWFTLHGGAAEADGAVPLEILRHIGGSLDDEPTANRARVGQARWRALGCDQGLLDYRFDESPWAEEFLGLQGQLSLRRLGGCAGD